MRKSREGGALEPDNDDDNDDVEKLKRVRCRERGIFPDDNTKDANHSTERWGLGGEDEMDA